MVALFFLSFFPFVICDSLESYFERKTDCSKIYHSIRYCNDYATHLILCLTLVSSIYKIINI